ncbi:hypothetical protein SAMN05444679_1493 [Variovorax sp. CF079]|nr:hypothetical protein [Variovorax sp. CF079]SDE97790.1 hypothetical protein SAMN05444679_1493 [Variovorax sp. CF079]
MDTTHAKLQPRDPVAARLGVYMTRVGIVMVAIVIAVSFLRG